MQWVPIGELAKNTQIILFKREGDLRHILRWNKKGVIYNMNPEYIMVLESKEMLQKGWDTGANLKELTVTEAKKIWQQNK